jgi:hypothetical protein
VDQARCLIGEFVNERGDYAVLSSDEFNARCELINAVGLLLILNMAHIIFLALNIVTPMETARIICSVRRILALYRLMYDVRYRMATSDRYPNITSASLRVDKFMFWPDAEALRKHFKLSASISLCEWKAVAETSELLSVDPC